VHLDAVTLEAETARIARATRFPDRLREVYAALGDDPVLVQEELARPVLVERLARRFFATDARIHAEERGAAETAARALGPAAVIEERPDAFVVRSTPAGGPGPRIAKITWDDWWGAHAPEYDERQAGTVALTSAPLPLPSATCPAQDQWDNGSLD